MNCGMSCPPGARTPAATTNRPRSGHPPDASGAGLGGAVTTAFGRRTAAAGADAGLGRSPCTARAMALMCAGVVPQHPPTRAAPLATNRRDASAKYPVLRAYRSWRPRRRGTPALGWTLTGSADPSASPATTSCSTAGPTVQFAPIAVILSAASAAPAAQGPAVVAEGELGND